jgi:hypothetical protein
MPLTIHAAPVMPIIMPSHARIRPTPQQQVVTIYLMREKEYGEELFRRPEIVKGKGGSDSRSIGDVKRMIKKSRCSLDDR